ncbi:MAG TPA: ABC transporter ATP-binding protein [Bryobacteraceae bacterium]|nr:ABC transporter ATP-binding protein [Bryobacteraceae bacterium]
MLQCRNVSKQFGDFVAVHDISFEVRGGVCALLGPNGAGKSTLLKILSGLLPPDRGEVLIAGRDIAAEPLRVKRMIGVLPEDQGLFGALTVEEHLELSGPVYGLSHKETRARGDALLRVLGLEAGRNTYLDQCSHGMRKKTALAMALLHNPRVLMLDEPFEGIDPVSSVIIRDLLLTAASHGIAVFLTSHDLSMIGQLASEIKMIRGGRIVFSSAASELQRPLEELYFDLIERPPQEDLPWLRSSPS